MKNAMRLYLMTGTLNRIQEAYLRHWKRYVEGPYDDKRLAAGYRYANLKHCWERLAAIADKFEHNWTTSTGKILEDKDF